MKTLLRLAVLACTSLVGLVVAGSALAAYQPRITVRNPSDALGAAGSLTIHVEQPRLDDATFRLVIYVPVGYTSALVPADGATIGTIRAQAQANAISPDAVLELTGNIVADSTFTAAEYPQAAPCLTNSPIATPAAVYRLVLTAAGQTLIVPLYVAPITTPPLNAAFSAAMVACLPSPYIPPPQGATFGAKLINADLTINGVFTNPATAGAYRWSTLWTPYTVNTGVPNAAGTVEAQSVDQVGPNAVSLVVRTNRRAATFSGSLTSGGQAVPNARVQLFLGRTAGGVRGVGTVTTNARGLYTRTFRNRLRGLWYARARAVVPDRTTTCVQTFAPVPCIASNVAGFTAQSRTVRFRIR